MMLLMERLVSHCFHVSLGKPKIPLVFLSHVLILQISEHGSEGVISSCMA